MNPKGSTMILSAPLYTQAEAARLIRNLRRSPRLWAEDGLRVSVLISRAQVRLKASTGFQSHAQDMRDLSCRHRIPLTD